LRAEEFILDKWNSCIWMTRKDYPNNIIMVYDPTLIRQKKLNSLFDDNEEIIFHKSNESKVLFVQDYDNKYLYINFYNIWSVLKDTYKLNYNDIKSLIKTVLLEDNKLNVLTPANLLRHPLFELLEDNKLNVLTPIIGQI
jgi:hypothetical protein